jgi:hypothetical protein
VLTRTAALLLVLAVAGCGSDEGDRRITVGGQQVRVASLVDAHAGLCDAARDPAGARRPFFDRSHEALHTVADALDDVDRAQAAQLLQAKEKVESELADPPETLPDDLFRLADIYRASLGRLAIAAPPCDK